MIYGLMVTKNEEHRYLEQALDWLDNYVDQIFVYDDASTDRTREIAAGYGVVVPRQVTVPTFLDHEGRFRQGALRSLETVCQPTEDDWVFIADADEFFVAFPDDLDSLIEHTEPHHIAVRIRVHSVWTIEDGVLYHRVDGPWSTIYEPRLWKWRPHLSFADVPMGCRNEPVLVTMNPGLVSYPLTNSAILHYGYASPADRATRYRRYTSEVSAHGHSPTFIESITDARGQWESWAGEIPSDIR